MTPAAYAGAVLLAVGILALLAWILTHRGTGLLRLSGRLLMLLGAFFLASSRSDDSRVG
jgi:membrane-bound ClpP family serine protease